MLYTYEAADAIARATLALRELADQLARQAGVLSDELSRDRRISERQRASAEAIAQAADAVRCSTVLLDDWVRGKTRETPAAAGGAP